jgi:hypothetical protein
MYWATATFALVVAGVGFLLATIIQIHAAVDEESYFSLSIRFWATLGVLGVVVGLAFAQPVLALQWLPPQASITTMVLVCLPIGAVIVSGLRNAWTLSGVRRRRRRAMTATDEVEATVIARDRRLFGHDLLDITVEITVPDPQMRDDLVYRTRLPDRVKTIRFVETCPGDQWSRFHPGAHVRLRFDPMDTSTYAVLLFDPVG